MKAFGFVALAGAAAFFVTSAPALAQTKVKVGTLTCKSGSSIGFIVGSKKSYRCKYLSASGSYSERYSGSLTRIGLDVGATSKEVMVWAVFAPSKVRHRGLSGYYAGATADAAIGIGGGAKVLLGGSTKSIALQPVSIQGQTGVNLAVGVAELSLR
ncbi:DUF992 domain-containing protein [Hyphomicrobium sp.]|uniref:DUF992 domain-containing protein n=1 Tax=Hyphomicrobium sp. TaxID=82 RepID=UPI002FDCC2AA